MFQSMEKWQASDLVNSAGCHMQGDGTQGFLKTFAH